MPSDFNTIQAWCSIISLFVTGLASYLVYQTFSLQAQTLMEQIKINKLEKERSILEMNPVFSVKMEKMDLPPPVAPSFNPGPREAYLLTFTLLRSDIYYLKTETIHESHVSARYMNPIGLEKEIKVGVIEGSKLQCYYSVATEDIYHALSTNNYHLLNFKIKFIYKNMIGVEYSQFVHVKFGQHPIAESPVAPDKLRK